MELPSDAPALSHRTYALVVATSLTLLSAATAPTLEAAAEQQNRAGIVVRLSNDDIRKMCVFFDEESITGFELLQRAGLETEVDESPLGTAVCKIGGSGCGRDDCFCRYPTFWGYWTRGVGREAWRFSDVGSRERKVVDGSLDGWSWGRDGKPPPPNVTLDDVCPASAAAASVSPAIRRSEEPASAERPNYLPFAGFAVGLVVLSWLAYRRRRLR
jgi:hypothetical protein